MFVIFLANLEKKCDPCKSQSRDLAIALKFEGRQDSLKDLLELYCHKILMILLISVSIERA